VKNLEIGINFLSSQGLGMTMLEFSFLILAGNVFLENNICFVFMAYSDNKNIGNDMPDLLVKLYDIEDDWGFIAHQKNLDIIIRKPLGTELIFIVDWVKENFSEVWASETSIAINNVPTSCFVAVQQTKPIGFACYDATALGYFGPTGVLENHRGKGTGKALLLACLLDMKLKGYGYAIIGGAGPVEFYQKVVGAVEIPGSVPGIWKSWMRKPD